jgi:hypothetical protein
MPKAVRDAKKSVMKLAQAKAAAIKAEADAAAAAKEAEKQGLTF